jgi:hypothetical protein
VNGARKRTWVLYEESSHLPAGHSLSRASSLVARRDIRSSQCRRVCLPRSDAETYGSSEMSAVRPPGWLDDPANASIARQPGCTGRAGPSAGTRRPGCTAADLGRLGWGRPEAPGGRKAWCRWPQCRRRVRHRCALQRCRDAPALRAVAEKGRSLQRDGVALQRLGNVDPQVVGLGSVRRQGPSPERQRRDKQHEE